MNNLIQNKIKRCGIYSFPKSGNTWMREIIRGVFKVGDNIREVVPDVYQGGIDGLILNNHKKEQWRFYKSHSAKELVKYQGNVVKNDMVIYILRNPFDVFCSQLNYLLRGFSKNNGGIQLGCASIDEAKQNGMINDFFSAFLVYGTLMPFFQDAGSWMENVRYWIKKSRAVNNVIVVKYEDMIKQVDVAMLPVLEHIGMDLGCLSEAMDLAATRTNDGGKFFWKKKEGTYRDYLENEQIKRFLTLHSQIIQMCGYSNHFELTL